MAQPRLAQLAQHLPNASPKSKYTICEQPLGTTRPLRIISIGAGASGINMARTLRLHMMNYTHVVYEKNPAVGGTWFENRYPGCKCDIPAHNYQFSWFPNPGWRSFFADAGEIEEYLCRACESEKLAGGIKLEHRVVGAWWVENKGQWRVSVENLRSGKVFDDWCHFLLDGTGILNNWKWPDIPGLHDFQGKLIHSANWPENVEYAGEKVAVIGNGSTGIQIVPAIQPAVAELVHFVRSPTWVVPPRLQALAYSKAGEVITQVEMDEDGNFSAEQIKRFKADPAFYKRFVKAMEEEVNGNFPITMKDSEHAKAVKEGATAFMRAELEGDERLCRALIPDFPVGCRRITPGVGYLSSLRAANTRVVTDKIRQVVPQGIELDTGEIIKLDIIICATGFDVSFCPRFPIVGRAGNLKDIWSKSIPQAYMSCAVPGLPNYFMFLGPSAPIGHGSVFTLTEHIAKYITRILLKCQTEGIKSLAPSPQAVSEFSEHIATFMPRTSWAGPCRSWFKGGTEDGPVTALHPGSRIHFFHMLEQFRGEDWEFIYEAPGGNRFAYLGNGFSTRELNPEVDSTWYLDEPDKL
ncbi:FAD/NAD(P)-binding domain-containing protein [Aspergillus heterothallicus]